MEHIALMATVLYTGFRFINFGVSTFRNAQYIRSGVHSHMDMGMTERQATFFEHGYAGHSMSLKTCYEGSCGVAA